MAKQSQSESKASESTGVASAGALGKAMRLIWVLLGCFWLFTVIAVAGYDPLDWPTHAAAYPGYGPGGVSNWCGPVGAWLAYQLYYTLGPGTWILLAGAGVLLGAQVFSRPIAHLPVRIVGFAMMGIALGGFVALQAPQAGAMPEGSGGIVAIYLTQTLAEHFAHVGTMLILLAILGVGAVVAMDEVVVAMPKAMLAALRTVGRIRPGRLARPALAGLPGRWGHRAAADDAEHETLGAGTPAGWRDRKTKRGKKRGNDPGDDDDPHAIDPDAGGLGGVESFDPDEHPRSVAATAAATVDEEADECKEEHRHAEEPDAEEDFETVEVVDEDEDEADAEAYDPRNPVAIYDEDDETRRAAGGKDEQQLTADAIREKIRKLPIKFAPQGAQETLFPQPAAPQQDLSGYQFPPVDTLVEPETSFSDEVAEIVREQAQILGTALQTYKIDAEVVGIDAGPVITLYEVKLAPGTKVAALNNISSDIARELKAQNVRIVPNTAGKSTVGIEVPNLKKEKVRMRELMALGGEKVQNEMALPMFLGKDASGNPLIQDLAAMPHMLIAGTTGSGKSVCMNTVIMSFLYTKRPDELKLILVDPKMVEMSQFKDIPHLMCPVITEMGKASAALEWAVTKMDERYEILAEAGVRDLDSYNQMSWEELVEIFDPQTEAEEAKIPRKLPRIVFVIDELADLMMTNKEVESFIVRIAQKARAVGIHLILATQRPQANVVTGLIKSNMPCRIAFQVASGMDSRIVLDQKGGELLLGHGDMLFLSPRSSKLTRAQGTLVDDIEIRKTVKFLKDVAEPSFEPQLVQLKSGGGSDGEPAERDDLFEDAVRVVLDSQRGSVSLLQRRLGIGYSRSSRLIEEMAEAGIIGAYKGSQAREVMMTLDEWDAMQEQMRKDAEAGQAAVSDADANEDLGETSWDQ